MKESASFPHVNSHFQYSQFSRACRWVDPRAGLLAERWDAGAHVGFAGESQGWSQLDSLRGRLREGWRVPASEAAQHSLYQPSSIRSFRLQHEPPRGSTAVHNVPTVKEGDVVVSKFLPMRTALVTTATPRLPVDSNCIRISGLSPRQGFWLGLVLAHPTYQEKLLRGSVSASVPRVGLRDLRSLRVPDAPEAIDQIVDGWEQQAEAEEGALREIDRLQAEVNEYARSDGPGRAKVDPPRFHSAADVGDSWLPEHTALRRFQSDAGRFGWRPLQEHLTPSNARLRHRKLAAVRVLRLGHADSRLALELPELAEVEHPSFRIYADPLRPAEVLISVLGSSPKVAVNMPALSTTVWVADHWARVRSTDHAGATALLLRTPEVDWQLRASASGVARQFVSRTDLERIVTPSPPAALRARWHARLEEALERRGDARRQLESLLSDARVLVDRAVGAVQ